MAGMTWRTLIVEDDGTLVSTPSKMFAETGDGVAWFVHNESGVRVKLRIKDIKKKSSGTAFSPIDFFTDHVTVDDGEIGMIAGQITFLPSGSSLVAIAPAGRELLDRVRTRKDAYLARRLRELPPDERATLDRAAAILERLLEEDQA